MASVHRFPCWNGFRPDVLFTEISLLVFVTVRVPLQGTSRNSQNHRDPGALPQALIGSPFRGESKPPQL